MPLLIQFAGYLLGLVGNVVFKILFSLGVGAVTFVGVKFGLDWFMSSAIDQFKMLPPEVFGMIAKTGVGSVISIFSSALTIRLTLDGLKAAQGSVTRIKQWGGGAGGIEM